jgi:hypothetical protein
MSRETRSPPRPKRRVRRPEFVRALTRAGAWLTFAALAVGTALLGAAMRLYPGGSVAAPDRQGHSFWLNYLCDLTNDTAVNGASNAGGSAVARAGMLTLSVTLGLVWLILPRLLEGGRWSKGLARWGGVLCALGLIAVPSANGALHAPVILATVVPGVSAMGTTLVGFARAGRRGLLGLALAVLAVSVVGAAVYAAKVAGWLPATAPVVPASQRIAALLLVTWMAAVAAAVLRAEA